MKPSFLFGAHCELHVTGYSRAVLSAPALGTGVEFSEKDLVAARAPPSEGKHSLEDHLQTLGRSNVVASDRPLLVLGMRNNLVNLRAPILLGGQAYAVSGENPDLTRRPYYGIGVQRGRLAIGLALGGADETWPGFFCAGVPVLWDEFDDAGIFERILTEASDHSHVFNLPRGQHPEATDETRTAWQTLHSAFRASVHADYETALVAMQSAIASISPPLCRCDDYLHAVIGTRDDGSLVCLYAHGRLEALGRLARERGCRRALCVENSGSVMPTYLPGGLSGERIPLLRAPNFRPLARALLILELDAPSFASAPIGIR